MAKTPNPDVREDHIRAAWARADGWQELADKLHRYPWLRAMCETQADHELTLAADLLADLQTQHRQDEPS